MPADPMSPAAMRRLIGTGRKVRVFIRGWFTPLHGEVTEVSKNQACIAGKWVTLNGPKADVKSVEVIS